MTKTRFSSDDWLALGLDRLKHKGPSALTIDALCAAADKTRGSFYFHFESIEAFHIALAQDWARRFSTKITERAPPASNRTDLLNELAGRLDIGLETGIRQLALTSKTVQEIVTRADEQRTDWLAGCYRACGQYSDLHAAQLAKIEIAAFTGFRLVDPYMKPAEARDLYAAFLELTGRT